MPRVGIIDYGMGSSSVDRQHDQKPGEAVLAGGPPRLAARGPVGSARRGRVRQRDERAPRPGFTRWLRAAEPAKNPVGDLPGHAVDDGTKRGGRLPVGPVPGGHASAGGGGAPENPAHGVKSVVTPTRPDAFDFPSSEENRFYFTHLPRGVRRITADGRRRQRRRFYGGVRPRNHGAFNSHPEKSHRFGLALFRRFLAASPC